MFQKIILLYFWLFFKCAIYGYEIFRFDEKN